jgi:hypothetical protein
MGRFSRRSDGCRPDRPQAAGTKPTARRSGRDCRGASHPPCRRRTPVRRLHRSRGAPSRLPAPGDPEPLQLRSVDSAAVRRLHPGRRPRAGACTGAGTRRRLRGRPARTRQTRCGGQSHVGGAVVGPAPPPRPRRTPAAHRPRTVAPGSRIHHVPRPPGTRRGVESRPRAHHLGRSDTRRLCPGMAPGRRRRRHRRGAPRRSGDGRAAARGGRGGPPLAGRGPSRAGRRTRGRSGGVAAGDARAAVHRRLGFRGTRAPGRGPQRGSARRSRGRLVRRGRRRGGVRRPDQVHRPMARAVARTRALGREAARGRAAALDIRVVRIVDEDLGGRWPRTATRLGTLLASPGPSIRRLTTVPRSAGRRRIA